MNRYYLVNKEPKLISLLDLIKSMTDEKGVLKCKQSELENIISLDVFKFVHMQDVTITRVI